MIVWLRRVLRAILAPARALRRDYYLKKYNGWLKKYNDDSADLHHITYEHLKTKPLFSIIVPTYNTPVEFLSQMIESVVSQYYDNWELIIVDDASTKDDVKKCIKRYAKDDKRIKPLFLKKNLHIAGATNKGIQASTGDFISLLDHDDLLYQHALLELAKVVNDNKNIEIIYTDEDKVDERGYKYEPMIKPAWNPSFLRSINYITHMYTVKKGTVAKAGILDNAYNGSQDWEFILRTTRITPSEAIAHIPKVLYSWRVHSGSTAASLDAKPYVLNAQKKALEADIIALGRRGHIFAHKSLGGQWETVYDAPQKPSYATLNVRNIDEDITLNNEMKTADLILFKIGKSSDMGLCDIERLVADALQADSAFVVGPISHDGVIKNLRSIMNKEQMECIENLPRRAVSRHYYRTCRYNIGAIQDAKIVIIESKKLLNLLETSSACSRSLRNLSGEVAALGMRNIYNPLTEMVE